MLLNSKVCPPPSPQPPPRNSNTQALDRGDFKFLANCTIATSLHEPHSVVLLRLGVLVYYDIAGGHVTSDIDYLFSHNNPSKLKCIMILLITCTSASTLPCGRCIHLQFASLVLTSMPFRFRTLASSQVLYGTSAYNFNGTCTGIGMWCCSTINYRIKKNILLLACQ